MSACLPFVRVVSFFIPLIVCSLSAYTQDLSPALTISTGETADAIPQLNWPAPNVEQLWQRAFWHEAHTGKTMQGEVIEASADFFDSAVFHTTESGTQVWELALHISDAPALCVYFDQFHLPVGGRLWLHSEAGVFSMPFAEGPIDHSENNDHGLWVSGEIPGETVVLHYEQPFGVVGNPVLHINGLGYFFRYLWLDGEYDLLQENNRGSDPCEVDVNCPEGEDWICQRDAVVRLRITQNGGMYLCSGAMVNNTAQDCKQLLLSSFHCADEAEESDWPLLKVRYNYEFNECGGTAGFASHDRTGVYFLSSSDDNVNGNINGSDFLILEVEDPVFDAWTPFYAGWDVSGVSAEDGVGIHHPAGDRKKISTYTNNLLNSSVYHPQAHWRVTWIETETDHGVTEGGSSGSPLFDQNKRIVGTLTGGASFCTNATQPDYYGKMSYHWTGNNPISEEEKLHNFLDPMGTGIEILDGSYVTEFETPCAGQSVCGVVDVEEAWLRENPWSLRPNPANETVWLDWSGDIRASQLRLYDSFGRGVMTVIVQGMDTPQFSVSALQSGLYYVTLETEGGATATRKLLVN